MSVDSSDTLVPPALEVTPHPAPKSAEHIAQVLNNPGFGRHFTDHMVRVDYTDGVWNAGAVVPYGPLELDPASMVLHYGQEIFEGLKAYRHADGSVRTFRPDMNAARFARSAHRLGMAELPAEVFVESLRALTEIDERWVPEHGGEAALYFRPFMIATEIGLGVRPANAYTYLLIASPAGAYFERGPEPVVVWLSTEYTRAAPGGTGEAKCGGNYAASLVAQADAARRGCDQVVWLDAEQHRFVEEMGGMNLFFVYGRGDSARVVTPALTGTLLPGVTRDSLLTLAAELGYGAEEGKVSVDDWAAGASSGELTEVFACGTAAVITPVGHVKSASGEWQVGDGRPGPVTLQLRERLLGVQNGTLPDEHGWMHTLLPAR